LISRYYNKEMKDLEDKKLQDNLYALIKKQEEYKIQLKEEESIINVLLNNIEQLKNQIQHGENNEEYSVNKLAYIQIILWILIGILVLTIFLNS